MATVNNIEEENKENDYDIRKLFLGDLYNTWDYEVFFSKKSEEGLFLSKLGSYFAYYKEDNPKKLEYKIIPCNDDKKKDEIKKAYMAFGFDFIDYSSEFLIFSRDFIANRKFSEGELAEDLKRFEAFRDKRFGKGIKFLLKNFFFIMTLVFLNIITAYRDGFFLSFARSRTSLFFIGIVVFNIFSDLRSKKKVEANIADLEANLKDKDPIYEDALKRDSMNSLLKHFFILLIIIFVALNFKQLWSSGNKEDVERYNSFLSQVGIESIYEAENLDGLIANIEEEHFEYVYDLNFSNPFSLLFKEKISTYETVNIFKENILVNEGFEGENTATYSYRSDSFYSRLSIDYYVSDFSFILNGTFNDIVNKELRSFKLEDSIFDAGSEKYLYRHEYIDNVSSILYKSEDMIILIEYYGDTLNLWDIAERL